MNQQLLGSPLIGGSDLQRALGYKSYAALYRAVSGKQVQVNVFRIPGRRGFFARTEDVLNWLDRISAKEDQTEARLPS